MPLRDRIASFARLFKERPRKTSSSGGLTFIEFRDVGASQLEQFNTAAREKVATIPGVIWVEVNPHTRRVMVGHDQYRVRLQQLVEAVEEAERSLPPPSGDALDDSRQLPDDDILELQRVLELLADAAGLWLGLGLRVVPLTPSSLGVNATALLSLVKHVERLRGDLDERLGRERADMLLNLASALTQAISERPLSSLVDIARKLETLRELRARRRVWEERKEQLCSYQSGRQTVEKPVTPRPERLPPGLVDRYAARAWMLAATNFGLSLATTRRLSSATAAAFGALPSPAWLGREVYAAELTRVLARRGTLVLAPDALRRLDRINCLVIEGDLVRQAGFTLGETATLPGTRADVARRKARVLFNPERPLEVRRNKDWTLGPRTALSAENSGEIEQEASKLSERGEIVLALSQKERIVALQQINIVPPTGMEEVIEAAEQSGLRVIISSNDRSVAETLDIYEFIPGGARARNAIQQLQSQGHSVCYVGTTDAPAFQAADCGIALYRPNKPTPWSAHIICGENLFDVRTLIRACAEARTVSRHSVRYAIGAAIVSTLVSGGAPSRRPSRRVAFTVSSASLMAMSGAVRSAGALGREQVLPTRDPTPWHALDAQGVLARLNSSRQGLSRQSALARITSSQPVRSASTGPIDLILEELFNPLTPLLAASAGLSALVGSTADAAMVAGAGGLTALVGGVQRYRTERSIRELVRGPRRPVRVWRDGALTEQDIDIARLVPGDVIKIGPGDEIPADCRLLEAQGLEIDSSALTGESLPIPKSAEPSYQASIADRACMLYAGTTVAAGHGSAVVVAVGDQTESHRTAVSIDKSAALGGVEKRLRSLMNMTGPVAVAAGTALTGAGLLRGRSLEELVDAGVSLAVASVPEGLPLLATAAQLSAAQRLAERGAMVRNPRSVEALGRVDVICVDKTGTLTEGRIELRAVHEGAGEQPVDELKEGAKQVLRAALRCTAVTRDTAGDADPMDRALFRGAAAAAVITVASEAERRIGELPFDPARGFHATLTQTETDRVISIKGIPELVLERCAAWTKGDKTSKLAAAGRRKLREEIDRLAAQGLRVVAVAESRLPPGEDRPDLGDVKDLVWLGMLLFRDRVRPTARIAVEALRAAGLRVVMLTGDHGHTAATVAEELALGGAAKPISGAELVRMGDSELARKLEHTAVFSRITPTQKVRVIRAMQQAGHVVAMVGDGANDAPGIRAADVGLAVGEKSTAAARGAADIVLPEARIETVVDAIVEGRAMWVSVRDAVSILVGGNLGEIGFSVGAGFLSGRSPLSPRQLLLVNLLTDVAPAMAIAVRPPLDTDLSALAREGPHASLGTPLNREIASRAVATTMGAGSGWLVGRLTGSRERAGTIGLVSLVGSQLGQTLVYGGMSAPVVLTSLASSAALFGIVQIPGLSHLFGCQPLGPLGWATAIGASAWATGASVLVPNLADRALLRVREIGTELGVPPAVLEKGADALRKLAEASEPDEGQSLVEI